jgi:hypothetical protein
MVEPSAQAILDRAARRARSRRHRTPLTSNERAFDPIARDLR